MTFKQTMAAIFVTAEGTYYKWKREKRPIISLLEMYSKEELEEFLQFGKISKFELLKEQEAVFKYSRSKYFSTLTETLGSLGDIINKDFMNFYFNVLVFSKDNVERQFIFEPFEIQKSSLIFATKNKFSYNPPKNELIPKFEVGIERLSQFDCYGNQFLYSNIIQEFKPMIQIDMDDLELKFQVEAYLHAMLFHLYSYHTNKSADEKRELFIEIVETLYLSDKEHKKIEDNLQAKLLHDIANTQSLDILLRNDFNLIQKNFDKILQAIEIA